MDGQSLSLSLFLSTFLGRVSKFLNAVVASDWEQAFKQDWSQRIAAMFLGFLLLANEKTRSIKQQLFAAAKASSKDLGENADLLNSYLSGDFKRFHNDYHLAREGRAQRADGTSYPAPLVIPGCGNFVWALTAAFITNPLKRGNIWHHREQAGPLGDAVESYLFQLYKAETPETSALLEAYAAMAGMLHCIIHDTPPAIYQKFHWRQSWASMEVLLEPWLGFQLPLAIEDRPAFSYK